MVRDILNIAKKFHGRKEVRFTRKFSISVVKELGLMFNFYFLKRCLAVNLSGGVTNPSGGVIHA